MNFNHPITRGILPIPNISLVSASGISPRIVFTNNVNWNSPIIRFFLVGLVSTDGSSPAVRIQVSTDGGGTWKATNEYDYAGTVQDQIGGNTAAVAQDTGNFDIQGSGLANSLSESFNAEITLLNASSTLISKVFHYKTSYASATVGHTTVSGTGRFQSASPINGVSFFKSAGNWITGMAYAVNYL